MSQQSQRHTNLQRIPLGAFVALTIDGQTVTYLVDQRYDVRGKGWTAVEYGLRQSDNEAAERIFLEVEREDGEWELALWRPISDIRVDPSTGMPDTLAYQGEGYLREEQGKFELALTTMQGSEMSYTGSYGDYVGRNPHQLLSVEYYPLYGVEQGTEVYVGQTLDFKDVNAYGFGVAQANEEPASSRFASATPSSEQAAKQSFSLASVPGWVYIAAILLILAVIAFLLRV
jgi:hypothetical protein